MSVRVKIPAPFRWFAGDQQELWLDAEDVAGLLARIRADYPELAARICEPDGAPKGFINIYLNEQDIRFLSGCDTRVADGDEVLIVPAIAGG